MEEANCFRKRQVGTALPQTSQRFGETLPLDSAHWEKQQLVLLPLMEAATISFPTAADEGVHYLWSLDYAHLSAFGQVYKNKSAHQSFPPEFPVYRFTPAPLLYLLDKSLCPQMGLNWEGKQKQNLEAWKPTDNPVIMLILLKKKKIISSWSSTVCKSSSAVSHLYWMLFKCKYISTYTYQGYKVYVQIHKNILRKKIRLMQ